MTIRSISNLQERKSPAANGLFETSIPNGNGRYTSHSIKYSTLSSNMQNIISSAISERYSLDNGSNAINISQLDSRVDAISSNDITFYGKKNFNEWPYVSADFPPEQDERYGDNFQYILPNLKKVREIANNNPIFMSTTDSYVAEGNPLPYHAAQQQNAKNNGQIGALDYGSTIGNGKFYFWQIDDQQTDSSQSVRDKNSGSVDGYEEIKDTGNLVVWGWLANNDLNPPSPECCWVALCAALKCENYNNTEQVAVPISVQPWIRGQNSSILQYVSFNVPVKAGLRLKIMTGFPVKSSNSAMQQTGSLTFMDRWIPNAFFGYIIKGDNQL